MSKGGGEEDSAIPANGGVNRRSRGEGRGGGGGNRGFAQLVPTVCPLERGGGNKRKE